MTTRRKFKKLKREVQVPTGVVFLLGLLSFLSSLITLNSTIQLTQKLLAWSCVTLILIAVLARSKPKPEKPKVLLY